MAVSRAVSRAIIWHWKANDAVTYCPLLCSLKNDIGVVNSSAESSLLWLGSLLRRKTLLWWPL